MSIVAIAPVPILVEVPTVDIKVAGGTAINAANTNTFAYPANRKLLIRLNNTTAATKIATFAAGVGPAAGQGALAISMAQDTVKDVILQHDRHVDIDGNVSLTYADSMTGFVQSFYLPQ